MLDCRKHWQKELLQTSLTEKKAHRQILQRKMLTTSGGKWWQCQKGVLKEGKDPKYTWNLSNWLLIQECFWGSYLDGSLKTHWRPIGQVAALLKVIDAYRWETGCCTIRVHCPLLGVTSEKKNEKRKIITDIIAEYGANGPSYSCSTQKLWEDTNKVYERGQWTSAYLGSHTCNSSFKRVSPEYFLDGTLTVHKWAELHCKKIPLPTWQWQVENDSYTISAHTP